MAENSELLCIPFSHYVEKARWGLDWYGVPYRERRYMPLLHLFPALFFVRGAGRADSHSSPWSTPALRDDSGQVIAGSQQILQYLSTRFKDRYDLYPSPEVAQWETSFDDDFGPYVRLYGYHQILSHPEARALTTRVASNNVGPLQQRVTNIGYPILSRMLQQVLGIREDSAERAQSKVFAMFDRVSEHLVSEESYLVGGQLTAADIAFSALAAPALMIDGDLGYGGWLPGLDLLEGMGPYVDRLRATPAGRYAMRIYREYRLSHRTVR